MNQDIFNPTRVTATVGGKKIIFETGRLANQAHGAVWVQCGGTVVLVTVCSQALEFDKGFFPLTVEYSEKMYAAGRIPGSFFRREIELFSSLFLGDIVWRACSRWPHRPHRRSVRAQPHL